MKYIITTEEIITRTYEIDHVENREILMSDLPNSQFQAKTYSRTPETIVEAYPIITEIMLGTEKGIKAL